MLAIVIPLLVGLAVFLIGGAVVMAQQARHAALAARLAAGVAASAPQSSRRSAFTAFSSRLGSLVSGGKSSRTLREELGRAGYYAPSAAATFLGAKVILLMIGGMLGLMLVQMLTLRSHQALLLACMIAVIFFFLPNLVVASRRRQRRQEISCHLPDAIDLLEIAVCAGMGMDQAWNAVTDEIRGVCPVLSDEMALTNLEIHLGATRAVAMRHMADRTGAVELSSLVACLLQSERFGTSIRDALHNFANNLREIRSQKAQEAAEKMAVKLLFPMVLFIFPPAILVMAGPAALSLSKSLSGFH